MQRTVRKKRRCFRFTLGIAAVHMICDGKVYITSLSIVLWGQGIENMMAHTISLISVSPFESPIGRAGTVFSDSYGEKVVTNY